MGDTSRAAPYLAMASTPADHCAMRALGREERPLFSSLSLIMRPTKVETQARQNLGALFAYRGQPVWIETQRRQDN